MTSALDANFRQLDDDLARVKARLLFRARAFNAAVQEPIDYAFSVFGHLYRPMLVLTSAYILAHDLNEPALPEVIDAAAAVELLHIATLHHDDIIDNAQTRRGNPTMNAKFGQDVAILTGDFLLAASMQTSASLGVSEMQAMCTALTSACVGQMLETSQLYEHSRSEADYISAIEGKTAALMRAAALIGAIVSGADVTAQEAFASFGRHLGIAFQIWDDILDLSVTARTGKPTAQDIDNGVYTLPVIYAMGNIRDDLMPLLEKQPLTDGSRAAVITLLEQCGALRYSVNRAQNHLAEAFAAIATLNCLAGKQAEVIRRLQGLIQLILPRHADFNLLSMPAARVAGNGSGPYHGGSMHDGASPVGGGGEIHR